MPRPLIQRSTEELSVLFDEWRNDHANLRVLFDELQHRDRPRAVKLREQVEQVLRGGHAEQADDKNRSKQGELPLSENGGAAKRTEKKKAKDENRQRRNPRRQHARNSRVTSRSLTPSSRSSSRSACQAARRHTGPKC